MTSFEKPLHILHVVSSLNMGGAEQFVVEMSRAMNKETTVAEVLSYGESDDTLVERCCQYGIKVHQALKDNRFRQLFQIRSLLRQYDIVHIHSSHCLASILFASLLLPKIRLFYTRHNSVVHQTLKWRFVYRLASFKLNKIVFISEVGKQTFVQAYPAFHHKSTLIYNGIQPIAVQRASSQVIRLGQVGRFVPLKAQRLLLQALSYLPKDQRGCFVVNFYGDGPLLEDCRELAAPLQQDMVIDFHGLEMDKTKIYQHIDVLVVTSETEGLSLVMLEALSAGCLVVATEVGGNAEIVQHEQTGLLFQYPDVQQLSRLLQQLLRDKKWQHWAVQGKLRYTAIFTEDQCVQSYLKLYTS